MLNFYCLKVQKKYKFNNNNNNNNDNNNNNNNNNNNINEFISAYLFYMKLALRPKIIYTRKKYYTMRYCEIIS